MSDSERTPFRRHARKTVIAATALGFALIGSLATATPALALWSLQGGAVSSTATAGTLPSSTPTMISSNGISTTLALPAARSSATLAPNYTLERSTTNDFANPVTIGSTTGSSLTDDGHLPLTTTPMTFTKIAVGLDAACGIHTNGKIMCWGAMAQMGQGVTTGTSATPLAVKTAADTASSQLPSGATFTDLVVGLRTFCASTSTAMYCWGTSEGGQVNGTVGFVSLPKLITGLPAGAISSITVGFKSACAIVASNAYCWGYNSNGQLGTGVSKTGGPYTATKVVVSGNSAIPTTGANFTMIRTGYNSTCAVASGVPYCWGFNASGNLGNSTTAEASYATKVYLGGGSIGIAPGAVITDILPMSMVDANSTTCAIAAGSTYCWGSSANGAMADSSTTTWVQPFKVADVPAGVTGLSSGHAGFCAVKDGQSYCWGGNLKGQTGNGLTANATSVVTSILPAGKTVVATSGSADSRCWLFSDNTVGCAGSGTSGQLADTRTGDVNSTIQPASLASTTGCAAGASVLGDGLCSLAPKTTYYYRMSYTLGNWSSSLSTVAALPTAG